MNEEDVEKLGEWVENQLAQLLTHQRRDAREQVAHVVRRVGVVRRNQVVPQLAVVQEQLRARRNPPAKEPRRLTFALSEVAPCGLQGFKNRPAPFPGRMSYKATKPGSVCPVS